MDSSTSRCGSVYLKVEDCTSEVSAQACALHNRCQVADKQIEEAGDDERRIELEVQPEKERWQQAQAPATGL